MPSKLDQSAALSMTMQNVVLAQDTAGVWSKEVAPAGSNDGYGRQAPSVHTSGRPWSSTVRHQPTCGQDRLAQPMGK